MKNNSIRNIEIRDFKCFKKFKAKGFARVNLVSGKNNVGKTAFLEACYINSASTELRELIGTLNAVKFRREVLNVFKKDIDSRIQVFIEQSNAVFIETNLNLVSFKIKDTEGIKSYSFRFNGKSINVNVNDFSFDEKQRENVNFIGNFGVSNGFIRVGYSSVQKNEGESYIDQILNDFDSSIEAFKIIDDVPQCKVNNKYLPVSELGDGVRHLVSIVTSLYKSKDGSVYIDEVDNGIHYLMLDNIWKIIMTLSKKFNVQVFTSTHSKECIESYARVSKQLNETDLTYTILTKLKDGSIDAGVYNAEMLINTLEQEHEIRGW